AAKKMDVRSMSPPTRSGAFTMGGRSGTQPERSLCRRAADPLHAVVTPPAHGPCNARRMGPIGRKRWAIAEGYIPAWSTGAAPQLARPATCRILTAGDAEATVRISVSFADREPAGPYTVTVAPRRTDPLRFNALEDPEPIPKDTPFASVIES